MPIQNDRYIIEKMILEFIHSILPSEDTNLEDLTQEEIISLLINYIFLSKQDFIPLSAYVFYFTIKIVLI